MKTDRTPATGMGWAIEGRTVAKSVGILLPGKRACILETTFICAAIANMNVLYNIRRRGYTAAAGG